MNTEEIRRNTGDPPSWGGKDPTQAPRGDEAVRAGVGEVHSSEEARNERGAKGPQFQGSVTSGKRAEIGESLVIDSTPFTIRSTEQTSLQKLGDEAEPMEGPAG